MATKQGAGPAPAGRWPSDVPTELVIDVCEETARKLVRDARAALHVASSKLHTDLHTTTGNPVGFTNLARAVVVAAEAHEAACERAAYYQREAEALRATLPQNAPKLAEVA